MNSVFDTAPVRLGLLHQRHFARFEFLDRFADIIAGLPRVSTWLRAVINGRGDELIEVAKSNLLR